VFYAVERFQWFQDIHIVYLFSNLIHYVSAAQRVGGNALIRGNWNVTTEHYNDRRLRIAGNKRLNWMIVLSAVSLVLYVMGLRFEN
jgi:hypothetical protein